MRTILATIKPEHLSNIRAGKKLWEVRKRTPTDGAPFRVLCCESGSGGQIKAEFICSGVIVAYGDVYTNDSEFLQNCCLSAKDIAEYADGKRLFFWRITNVIDYCNTKGYRVRNIREFGRCSAPQSWMYVRDSIAGA